MGSHKELDYILILGSNCQFYYTVYTVQYAHKNQFQYDSKVGETKLTFY